MSASAAPVPTVNKGLSDAGRTFIGVAAMILFLSSSAVALRITGRIKEFRTLYKDDYTIILAWLTCFTTVTLSFVWVSIGGVGWSIVELPPAQLLTFFKIFYGLQLLYVFSVFTVKISILFLYIRIFDTPKFKIAAYSTLGLCVAWFIASFLVAIFLCNPVEAAWDLALLTTGATCLDKQELYWAVGISNLLLDALILALPLPVIWHLSLNKQKKAGLSFIFLTGSIVCLSSILRVTSIGTIAGSDFTKTIVAAALWSSIEANVAVIAACLPTLGHVFLRFRRGGGTTEAHSHATPNYDPERSGLTRGSELDTMKSQRSRKVFDPYSTNVDVEKYEMSHKMTGWKSGTNEAYVEMKAPEGDEESLTPTTPYESNNVMITTHVKSEEAVRRQHG